MTSTALHATVRVSRIAPDADVWRRAAHLLGSHVAHAPEWAAVIRHAYRHDPLYLAGEDEAGRVGLLPAVVVRRPFFGTLVASMPYLDGGGPCTASPTLATALVETLISEAREIGACRVEVRCAHKLDIAARPSEHKVNLMLSLPADPTCLWSQLERQVRNQVRKAERSGLVVDFGGAPQLEEFYAIYAARMRDLGSPPHDRAFFQAVADGFGRRARVALVRKGGIAIGGLVSVSFNETVAVPWACCLKEYFQLCPNNLLYWETIRAACLEGFRQFDFGRSTRDSGPYRFKRQWGAVETPLFWYTIPIGPRSTLPRLDTDRVVHDPTMSPMSWQSGLTRLWRHLPLTLTRSIGPHVRKYLIQ